MDNSRRKLILIIAGSVVLLGVIGLVVSLLTSGNQQKNGTAGTGDTTSHFDPVSKETIVTQNGKAPETGGGDSTRPIFAGIDKLLNYGITTQQLSSLQFAFTQYAPTAGSSTQISLAVDDITTDRAPDPDGRFFVLSHVVVNQKDTYKLKLFYSGLSDVQLVLYDSSGQSQLFDSGVISDTNSSGDD